METTDKTTLTVACTVNAPLDKVWKYWTTPRHIIQWAFASDEWHAPYAENELRNGGRFLTRMEAKDGSMGFDFTGSYDVVEPMKKIEYTMDDGRKATITFEPVGNSVKITTMFEAEETNSLELQQGGWQAIADNFKKHVENSSLPEDLYFEITIDAPVEKVYKTMLEDKTYREWTKAFNDTSRFEGSWKKGSKILFIGEDEKGEQGGMVSRIKENIPNRFVSIEHYGLYKNGEEIIDGPEVEKWAGSLENYTFREKDGGTLLSIDMDSNEEYKSYFVETWPKALYKLKELSEK